MFSDSALSLEKVFYGLFNASSEQEVDDFINKNKEIFRAENWKPLGNNFSNYGVIENQQASPIAALVEKITNSIDATLMRRCYEEGIDPKSSSAPKSMEEAVKQFYGDKAKNWDLSSFRKAQAENIQIVASGKRIEPSLVIYDNGEGQHPNKFEDTFLSLLRGNKNEIQFVQGKYNMGGSGAIVFCGKKGYQLVASKRYDLEGDFGFTLIREHPLVGIEKETKKNTWYEFLTINEVIPSFKIDELDLKLYNRKFKSGTIIKLYSYNLPSGSRSVISRDLNQSLNEYLFEPALPILTVDTKERYPDDRNLERPLYGLKRRLEQDDSKYVEETIVSDFRDQLFGQSRVTCYVFRTKVEGKTVKESKETIQREFFKNDMSVLFSMNGQVHGHYSSEFITRSLKLGLLKNHLLIHVDCTNMNYDFRKELFMASRDRLKDSEETRSLRKFLADKLGKAGSRLNEIEKKRKDSISVDSSDSKELLKNVAKNIMMSPELRKLLGNTFKLEPQKDEKNQKEKDKQEKKQPNPQVKEPFKPKRYPSYLKLQAKNNGEQEVTKIPLGGERTIRFGTDVENQYFNRIEEPGELKIGLLGVKKDGNGGGDGPGTPSRIEELLNVSVSSPHEGCIKVVLNPQKDTKVGDALKLRVSLTSPEAPEGEFEEIFWVKITEKEAPPQQIFKEEEQPLMGLPEPVFMYKEAHEKAITWEEVANAGIEVNYRTIIHPLVTGDNLEKIYINMDSEVLKNFRAKHRNANEEQLELAGRKYWTAVYMHTLFLYSITKNRKYQIIQVQSEKDQNIEIGDYIKDLFENYYSEFILNYGGMEELMSGLAD